MVKLTVPKDLLANIRQAVAAHQPELEVETADGFIVVTGRFVVSGPEGPFDSYEIKLAVTGDFPRREPVVFETGGRIPRVLERHIYPQHGCCCLGVWEEWLVTAPEHTFDAFITGVLHDYFLSQTHFEIRGEWPFGERSHGKAGILEGFAELLDIDIDAGAIAEYLRLLSMNQVKGHHSCPCGSGKPLRRCHRSKVDELKKRISAAMARRMLNRIGAAHQV